MADPKTYVAPVRSYLAPLVGYLDLCAARMLNKVLFELMTSISQTLAEIYCEDA